MSREYIFYPSYMSDNKAYPLLFDFKGNPASTFWRSGSFIDGQFFTSRASLKPEEISDTFALDFTDNAGYEEDENTYTYFISEKELEKHAGNGLVSGYITIDQAQQLTDVNDKADFLHYEKGLILSSEIVAEMHPSERVKYVLIFGTDYMSTEWICSHLAIMLNNYIPPQIANGGMGYLIRFSY